MNYVAIIGGLYDQNIGEKNKSIETARIIGEALAKSGMGLVVYHSEERSIEPHVVSGYVEALEGNSLKKSVRVRYAESQRGIVKFKEQDTHPELFDIMLFPSQEWEAPFYRSLVEVEKVDAALFIAGGRSTFIAGQITMARDLPVLAIAEHGGSSAAIWSEMAQKIDNYPSLSAHSVDHAVSWLKEQCESRSKAIEAKSNRETQYLKIVNENKKSLWTALAFVVLLVSLFFGLSTKPILEFYMILTFLALISAGATGAMVRSTLWAKPSDRATISVLLGSIAGIVVGLAYLIPQWVGAPGVLAPSAEAVTEVDKIQFASATLVAISAGVGFDTVFNRLKTNAEDQPIGV